MGCNRFLSGHNFCVTPTPHSFAGPSTATAPRAAMYVTVCCIGEFSSFMNEIRTRLCLNSKRIPRCVLSPVLVRVTAKFSKKKKRNRDNARD